MPTPKPECQRVRAWLTANLGKAHLGALTGTDTRALLAAVHIVELYSYDRSPRVAQAFGLVVSRMQERTRYLAFHAVAMVMEWETRFELWTLANLPALPDGTPECKNAR